MKIDVLHIAKLASLKITKNEIDKFESQLSSILDYIKKLQEVKTENIQATSKVTDLENITREDETISSFSQTEAISGTKSQHNGLFKTKLILE